MTGERWKEVTTADPCPACGKTDWCGWTPDSELLKCERTAQPPAGLVLVKEKDGGGLFRRDDPGAAGVPVPVPRPKRPKPGRTQVAAYDYRNANGELLYQVVRYEPKDFRQRRPDGSGGWIWKLDGVPRVLYRLPALLVADPQAWVFVVEGEKDVDNVRSVGLAATTNPGGKGKWKHLADDSALRDRRVAIIPDNDADGGGMLHAQDIAQRLHGKAADVRIVELPSEYKDSSEWMEALDSKEPADLAAALVGMAEAALVYEPDKVPACGPVIVRLSDVEPKPLRWLWPGRIPMAKLTIISGDPSLGKSTMTLDIAARVSQGRPWPDGTSPMDGPAEVVLLSAEDDIADTIRPRIDAANGDAGRILVLKAVRLPDVETGQYRENMFSLKRDLAALDEAVRSCGNPGLVIIDPVTAYLDGTDSHKNADIRGLLAPLADLASRRNVAIVAVSHLNKNSGGAAMYRTMGSLGFVAAARAGWLVVSDKDDPLRRLFLSQKTNLAPEMTGLAYRVESHPETPSIGVICWERDPVTISADEALAASRGDAEESSQLAYAVAWLKTALAEGPMLANEVIAQAKANNIAEKTLRRAQAEIGIKPDKGGFGGPWSWSLPAEGGQDGQG